MPTRSAARALAVTQVSSRAYLRRLGFDAGDVRRQVEAGRWRLVGPAIVPHRGPLTRVDRMRIALISCGPRSALTSFTALEVARFQGWRRETIFVLVRMGSTPRPVAGIPVRLHRVAAWPADQVTGRVHRAADAMVVAASSFDRPRPACAILAAGVQQGLVSAGALRAAVDARPRTRHRALLSAAVDDIAMGAHALSEIDFVALCRRHRLPAPILQAVRTDDEGRRRYLDAAWDLPDGRRVAVEVDGAVHIEAQRWQDDQLRQNEIVLGGTLVLRYPSVVVRAEEALVAAQLRRALGL